MAFTLYATTSGTTTQLNDDTPFTFESAEGFAGTDVVRHEQRGPYQHGNTDLGYRIQPRIITLNLLFHATTMAILDTYRQTLMAAFKPLDSTATTLYAQRDDSEVRKLSVFAVGDIEIALVPEHYASKLHRATLRLRAASPLWKANTETAGSVDFTGLTSYWLAGGAITSGSMVLHREPASGPVFFSGDITGDWAIALVTAKDTNVSTAAYVFADNTGGSASFRRDSGTLYYIDDPGDGGLASTNAWPGTTGFNYHVVESRSGTQIWRYWNNGVLTAHVTSAWTAPVVYDISLKSGSFFMFGQDHAGANPWNQTIRKAVIYKNTTTTQLQALGPYMLNTLTGTVTLVNDGDTYAYPVITMHGPVTDPVIVNTTTAGTLNLTGITLGTADLMTIDLRTGDKQIYNQAGSSLIGSVTTVPYAIANFALAPAPIAAGGTNTLVMTPGSVGSAATFVVQFTPSYMSF